VVVVDCSHWFACDTPTLTENRTLSQMRSLSLSPGLSLSISFSLQFVLCAIASHNAFLFCANCLQHFLNASWSSQLKAFKFSICRSLSLSFFLSLLLSAKFAQLLRWEKWPPLCAWGCSIWMGNIVEWNINVL